MKMFTVILGLSALAIAGTAAYFSVLGIGMLFAGATISAMVMASMLELGKVVSTSYLYRYWSETNLYLRVYLFIAILTLMGITYAGIFGFLSAAYQKSASEYGIFTQQIDNLTGQKQLKVDAMNSKKDRVVSLTANRNSQEERLTSMTEKIGSGVSATNVRRMQDSINTSVKEISSEIKKINEDVDLIYKDISGLDSEILKLKTSSEHSKDIVTFKFIADSLNVELNTVVKWFILIIIIVFDPLAVGLVLAYNIVVYGKMERSDKKNKDKDEELHEIVYKEKPIESVKLNKEKLRETYNKLMKSSNVSVKPSEVINEEVKVEEPIKETPVKKYSDLSDYDKDKMTFDEIQKLQDEERTSLRGHEYYHVADR